MKPTSKDKSKPFQKFYNDEKPKKKASFKVKDDAAKDKRFGPRRERTEDSFGGKRKDGRKGFDGKFNNEGSNERGGQRFGKEFDSERRERKSSFSGEGKSSFSGERKSNTGRSFEGKPRRSNDSGGRTNKFGKKFDNGETGERSGFGDGKWKKPRKSFEENQDRASSFERRPKKFGAGQGFRENGDKRDFSDAKRRGTKAFGDKERSEKSGFSDKGKKPFKKRNLRKFDEEDLSFGRKMKAESIVPEEPVGPEVTFTKELEDKWRQEMPRKVFEAKQGRPSEKGKRHEHAPKKKDFERYFDDEEESDMVYMSRGSKHKVGAAHLRREENEVEEDGLMPLNKYIAHCDVCGRREAAQLVKEGKVKVNGELITEPGHKVSADDKITLSGKKLQLQENKVYILLNKPKGFITTTDDPKGRRTVMDIFQNHIEERIFPIGRLDRNTTGLLLLTNDGDLAQKLAHPSNEIKKVYQVSLDKNLTEADFDKIKAGVTLEDGLAPVNQLAYLDAKSEIGLEIHNGKNRIVRRIFESLGYVVEKLDRVMYAGLTKKQVPRGQWRFLTKQEVINLKHFNKS